MHIPKIAVTGITTVTAGRRGILASTRLATRVMAMGTTVTELQGTDLR